MAWISLFIAGLLEVAWAFFMKQSDGFTKLYASIATITLMMASFGLLSFSMKTLPLGTAYAIWTGIGAVGSFILSVVLLGEQINTVKILSIAFIIIGLIGLKLSSGAN